jgi:hypothetical protein
MRTEHRQPTLADIRGALDRGRLVWISVDNDWGQVDCHAALVYGQRGDVFDVYSPELTRSCLQQYRRRRLDRVWLRSEGMTAVWRREPWRGGRGSQVWVDNVARSDVSSGTTRWFRRRCRRLPVSAHRGEPGR